MRKPPTGEPYAGKPPVRFGGRGGKASRPLSAPSRVQSRMGQAGMKERLPARTKEAEVRERKRRDGGRSSRRRENW